MLNFYTSFKIDQDTVAINLAGRQRYVSQRIARTLLELDAARTSGQPYKPETLAELRSGTRLFQISQAAFRDGGTIPGLACGGPAEAKMRAEQGFQFLTAGSDMGFMAGGAKAGIKTLYGQ